MARQQHYTNINSDRTSFEPLMTWNHVAFSLILHDVVDATTSLIALCINHHDVMTANNNFAHYVHVARSRERS